MLTNILIVVTLAIGGNWLVINEISGCGDADGVCYAMPWIG